MAVGGGGLLRRPLNCVGLGHWAQELKDRDQKLNGDFFLADVPKHFYSELFYTLSSQDILTHGGFSVMFANGEIKRNEMLKETHILPVHLHHLHKPWSIEPRVGFNNFG